MGARLMAIEVFDDRRVCDKCDKVFLYRNEITENIEGMFNPTINDDIYEGIYCFRCIQLLEEQN
jgi:polyferredoxin